MPSSADFEAEDEAVNLRQAADTQILLEATVLEKGGEME
jgi:hypothetical protein